MDNHFAIKTSIQKITSIILVLIFTVFIAQAQQCGFVAGDGCSNTDYNNFGFYSNNNPATIEYDNIISTYSSTVIRNTNGSFTVFGKNMANSGTGTLTTPQILNATNYPNLSTYKVLKVTGASYTTTSDVQYIALTSNGLYTWGSGRNIYWTLNGGATSFVKVNPTNGNNYSLPTGLVPSDVKMLTVGNTGGQYYGSLVIVTCSGEVWVLSSLYSTAVRGNGNTSGNETTWVKVQTSLNTPLTGIIAARIHGNTVIALRNDNTLWTWGTNSYLGDNSSELDRNYATQMIHPNSSKTIKMIGITGIGTMNNTYYALMTDGNLYVLGSNSSLQLGNWTGNSNIAKTWTQPRYTNSTGPIMDNIKWISPQENDQYYACMNVITNQGELYAWGANTVNMLGLPLAPTQPAAPSGLGTNKVLAVKTGGLFSLIVQENITNLGYTGNTIFGNVSTYNFNSIPINLCSIPSPPAPGGVSGAGLWYKSNAGITTETGISQWNNQASNNYNLIQATSAAQPGYNETTNQINFNPTVGFDGSNDFLQASSVPQAVTVNTSNQSSQYVVFKKNGAVSPMLYNHSNNLGGTFNVGARDNYILLSGRNSTFTSSINGDIRLQSLQGDASSGGAVDTRINGLTVSTTWTAGTPNNSGTQFFNVGASNGNFTISQIAEIIVFPNNTNATNERQRVESYLGLKYGITLPFSYMASDASIYWDNTTNTGYNMNITGIGRDDASGLTQKQSQSINLGEQVVIGVGGSLAESNQLNTNILTNKQFLTVGDNGLAKSLSVSISEVFGVNNRFAAIWKVQNTNSVGIVRVMWPKGIPCIKIIQSADTVFNASDLVTNMVSNMQTLGGVTYNYADVSLSNGQFFTFAGQSAPAITKTTVQNVCPSTAVNLNTLANTGTQPNGTTLVWSQHKLPITVQDTLTNLTDISTSGRYYALYFDKINSCYSPADSIDITIVPCCQLEAIIPIISQDTLYVCYPINTVILNGITASNQPTNATLTWHSSTPATNSNRIVNVSSLIEGTYFAAFYDSTNACFSTNTTPVTLIANGCAAGTINCAKTQIIPAPVVGTPKQLTMVVTVDVTTVGMFKPISVSGSGMSIANGMNSLSTTQSGIQNFIIPIKYDGSALGTFNTTINGAGTCSASLTTPPTKAILDTWTLDCVPTVGSGVK